MEALGLAVLVVLGWYWLDTLKARDLAVTAAREACTGEGLQLLDDTVSLNRLRLERNDNGHLRLRRLYRFDYSDTGNNRRRGSVVLLSHRVTEVHVKPRLVPTDRVLH